MHRKQTSNLVFFSQTANSVCVTMYQLILTKLWLHLVQPVQHGLKCFFELTRVQQRILQRFLSVHKRLTLIQLYKALREQVM